MAAVLMKTHFLSSTPSPHKYDLDKYGRHVYVEKHHGGRTCPDRNYGGSSYLRKSDFLISTVPTHKYDSDKYGHHVFRHNMASFLFLLGDFSLPHWLLDASCCA